MSPGQLCEVKEFVVRSVAIELKLSEATVETARSLKAECGMDSIAAANVAFVVEDKFGVELDLDRDDTFDSVDEILSIVQRALS